MPPKPKTRAAGALEAFEKAQGKTLLAAVKALKPLGHDAAPALRKLVKLLELKGNANTERVTPEAKIRAEAAEVLAAIGEAAFEPVSKLAKKGNSLAQRALALMDVEVLRQHQGELLALMRRGSRTAAWALSRIGAQIVPDLIEQLKLEPGQRDQALVALCDLGTAALPATDAIIACLPQARAATALASIGPACRDRAVPALVAAYRQWTPAHRESVAFIKAAMILRASDLVPRLLEELESFDPQSCDPFVAGARLVGVAALGQDQPRVRDEVERWVEHANPVMAKFAARALAELGQSARLGQRLREKMKSRGEKLAWDEGAALAQHAAPEAALEELRAAYEAAQTAEGRWAVIAYYFRDLEHRARALCEPFLAPLRADPSLKTAFDRFVPADWRPLETTPRSPSSLQERDEAWLRIMY